MSQRRWNVELMKSPAWQVCNASALAILLGAAISGCGREAAGQLPAGSTDGANGGALETSRVVNGTKRDSIGTAVSAPIAASTAKPLTVDELVKLAGEPCETKLSNAKCMSEEFDFELAPDCARTNYYAAVKNEEGVSVANGAPPKDTIERAVLARGQLVCVQAIARAGKKPSYLFATAVSAAHVGTCSGCNKYGASNAAWRSRHDPSLCVEIAPGRYTGGCVTGWVDAEKMEFLGNLR
jgi:hypothetical protein